LRHRCAGFELDKMQALMGKVVLDQEAQRDRRIISDNARCLKTVFGDAVHDGGKYFVFRLPPAQQCFPFLLGIAVRGDPRVLRIRWACIVPIDGCAHEALSVIGGGVK